MRDMVMSVSHQFYHHRFLPRSVITISLTALGWLARSEAVNVSALTAYLKEALKASVLSVSFLPTHLP